MKFLKFPSLSRFPALVLAVLALSAVSAHALQNSFDFAPLPVTQVTNNTLPPMRVNYCTEAADSGGTHQNSAQSSVISCRSAPIKSDPETGLVDATTHYEEKLQIVDLQKPEAVEASKQLQLASR